MKEILRTKVRDLLNMKAGQEVLAKGWVRTKRGNKEIVFVALNDGSTIKNIQIVIDIQLIVIDFLDGSHNLMKLHILNIF